jgi:hypothetical protein
MGYAHRTCAQPGGQSIQEQMPALLVFGDAQTANHPGKTSPERSEACCQVRMEQETLDQKRFKIAKLSRKPADCLNGIPSFRVQRFALNASLV